jgi:DNA-binding NtrC family response regulator
MKTILIIDKEYSTLLMLKGEFEEAGYEVVTTDSGDEALEILNNPSKPVNLVITNLRHAGPDMLDFLCQIKRAWPDVPVICFTALSNYEKLPPHDQPFDALIEKSSDLTKLKDSVARHLGKLSYKCGETSPKDSHPKPNVE